MSNRFEWEFSYSRDDLLKVIDQKIIYHTGRLDWWKQETVTAEAAIQEAGIDIREYPVTGGNRAELVVDPSLLKRFQETQSKIRGHQAKLDEYRRYNRAFLTQPPIGFMLDIEDVEFFGL